MIAILPDIIRAIVTDVMLVLLLHTVSTPKYKKPLPYLLATMLLVALNLAANTYFYIRDNYSAVVVVDFVMLLFVGAALKPLFLERLAHWIFGFVTMLNVYAAIVFMTWIAADYFPYPYYANTVLRLLLFMGIILVLRRWILPLYRQVVERWLIYIPLLIMLFLNMMYYFLYGEDVELTLTVGKWPIFLLIALGICIYISIFYSMRATLREYELREENQVMRAQEALLESELTTHNEFVEQARQHRHDLRHHNALLLEYLFHEDISGAREYLAQYDAELKNAALTDYCKHPVANAVIRRLAWRSGQSGIELTVRADIPETLPLTPPETGVLLSNLLENASEACEKSEMDSPFLLLTAEVEDGRLKIETRNSVGLETLFDENGFPKTTKQSGGAGTHSMARIVRKYGGMLAFRQSADTFITQIILPLN